MKEMFKTYMYNKIVNSKVNKNFPSHYRYTFKNVKTIFGLKFPFSIFALCSCRRVLVECNILVTFFSVFSPNYSLCLVRLVKKSSCSTFLYLTMFQIVDDYHSILVLLNYSEFYLITSLFGSTLSLMLSSTLYL